MIRPSRPVYVAQPLLHESVQVIVGEVRRKLDLVFLKYDAGHLLLSPVMAPVRFGDGAHYVIFQYDP